LAAREAFMHELSIALCVLDLVEEESERRGGARVSAVHVKLGPLSGVVKEALLGAFELAREGTAFGDCRLAIREMPIVMRCAACNAERSAVSVQDLRCGTCGAPAEEIVSGRELEVVAMEIEA
jgi:hydrogenase nickel incorporation protein HypA/HybF